MTQPIPEPVSVVLCDEEGGGRIVVDLDAFVRFTAHVDASLADLEAKWAHLAPPAALRIGRTNRTDKSPDI
jgi:hypothetical protein